MIQRRRLLPAYQVFRLRMPVIDVGLHGQNVQEKLSALSAQETMQSVYAVIAKESGTKSEPVKF